MITPFRYYLRVRYQECDPQHVVFNARYGDYAVAFAFPPRDLRKSSPLTCVIWAARQGR